MDSMHSHAEREHRDEDHAVNAHDAHPHAHNHGESLLGGLFHSHSHASSAAEYLEQTDERGLWALKVGLAGLLVTAAIQLAIAMLSGSASLLADTIHNFADAMTAIPLWIAFSLARRSPNRRFTYGYGRAEDLAGGFVIGLILVSALLAGYESFRRLLAPQPIDRPYWVMGAAIIGFLGNEVVAFFRIRVGHQIDSAALVADGQHARTDGLASLAVLIGAAGSLLGYPILDPLVGLLITVTILGIVWQSAGEVLSRAMDAIEPEVIETIEHAARETSGVESINQIRARWIGHRLGIGLNVVVGKDRTVSQGHQIALQVQDSIQSHLPQAAWVRVHVDPWEHDGGDAHQPGAAGQARPGAGAPN